MEVILGSCHTIQTGELNRLCTEFWSNTDGWVDIGSAERFTKEETQNLNLPIGGSWATLWEVNIVQFARFIAECESCGVFTVANLQDVAESMDLCQDEVLEVIDRAQACWDGFKSRM